VAKRRRREQRQGVRELTSGSQTAGTATGSASARVRVDTLGDFAEDLGRFLGTVQTRATSWLGQRQAIADQLTQIRDTANEYLQQLGSEGAQLAARFRKGRGRRPGSGRGPGRPPGSATAPAPRARRTMSAAARKRISDAQKERWAKLRAGQQKKAR
jgi:hypothetical protein